jgi:hypothetical protein
MDLSTGSRAGSSAVAIRDFPAASCPRIRAGTGLDTAARESLVDEVIETFGHVGDHDIELVATLLEKPSPQFIG